MDELRQLKDRHDALPGPDERTVAAARARLLAHAHRSGRRSVHRSVHRSGRRPRARRFPFTWGLGLAAAMTAAVVVIVPVVRGSGDPGDAGRPGALPTAGPRPPGATAPPTGTGTGTAPPSGEPSSSGGPLRLRKVSSAADLAGNAAALAAAGPDPRPEPHQWVYIKTESVAVAEDRKGTKTYELWRRADEKKSAYLEDGRLKVVKGSEFEVTYPYLFSLPTDPDALLARVYADVAAEDAKRRAGAPRGVRIPPLTAERRDAWAFQHIVQGMRDAVLPRTLRAAMYGALARIPGVRYEARAKDLAGRPGVTLYRVHEGYLRDEIFVDRETYEYLGYRTIAVRDHKEPGAFGSVEKGRLFGWGSVVASGIVDEPGRRP
ncbi:CU044_5270 family protein [Nonomuraea candida]|uniref:CU044_5270 family protein n=1 Tax=Nonomuraea candida TaxID=359159 RepID=UPI0005BCF980|nr:CU044_5270 family protein [Nonomuraea candida]